LKEYFFKGSSDFPLEDIPADKEVRTASQLKVPLPDDNLDFHKIALNLSRELPRRAALPADKAATRLREIVRAHDFKVDARQLGSAGRDTRATYWQLKMDEAWTVPAVELARGEPGSTVIVLADKGRAGAAAEIGQLLAQGKRVVAIDPFYFGESQIDTGDYLYAMLLAAVGERPLGLQASQVAATARWLSGRKLGPATVVAVGPRSSLFALVAAALEPKAIGGLDLRGSFRSLKEVLEKDLRVSDAPELFCFGLLAEFDIPQLAALAAPRPLHGLAP